MAETEPDILTLRKELSDLTRWRASVIDEANRMILEANRDYDARALILHRQIKALTPPEELPAPITRPTVRRSRRPRVPKLTGTEGWSAEDIEHYRALQLQQV